MSLHQIKSKVPFYLQIIGIITQECHTYALHKIYDDISIFCVRFFLKRLGIASHYHIDT